MQDSGGLLLFRVALISLPALLVVVQLVYVLTIRTALGRELERAEKSSAAHLKGALDRAKRSSDRYFGAGRLFLNHGTAALALGVTAAFAMHASIFPGTYLPEEVHRRGPFRSPSCAV